MPRTLYFPLAEVAALAEATLASTDWSDSFMDSEDGNRTGPALMWVKDDGTYLMSNAEPRLAKVPGLTDGHVVYGRADSPRGTKVDGKDYDLARAICGGDDFAEYLTIGPDADSNLGDQIRDAHRDGLKWLVIEVGRDSIGILVK